MGKLVKYRILICSIILLVLTSIYVFVQLLPEIKELHAGIENNSHQIKIAKKSTQTATEIVNNSMSNNYTYELQFNEPSPKEDFINEISTNQVQILSYLLHEQIPDLSDRDIDNINEFIRISNISSSMGLGSKARIDFSNSLTEKEQDKLFECIKIYSTAFTPATQSPSLYERYISCENKQNFIDEISAPQAYILFDSLVHYFLRQSESDIYNMYEYKKLIKKYNKTGHFSVADEEFLNGLSEEENNKVEELMRMHLDSLSLVIKIVKYYTQ